MAWYACSRMAKAKKTQNPITLAEHLQRIAKRGGQARVSQMSKEEHHKMAIAGGLKGGKARAAKLSGKARSEIARKAAAARWRKKSG